MTDVELPRAWWHGCWLEPGHYMFDRRGRSGRMMSEPCPVGDSLYEAPWLDGGLAPRLLQSRVRLPGFVIPADGIVFSRMAGDDRDQRQRITNQSEECPQGEYLLHRIAGCTIAAWWDRAQGDRRGACNSCLIIEGGNEPEQMMELFPRLFPMQSARLAAAGVQLRFLRWAQ